MVEGKLMKYSKNSRERVREVEREIIDREAVKEK